MIPVNIAIKNNEQNKLKRIVRSNLLSLTLASVTILVYLLSLNKLFCYALSICFIIYLLTTDTSTIFYAFCYIFVANELLIIETSSISIIILLLFSFKTLTRVLTRRHVSINLVLFFTSLIFVVYCVLCIVIVSKEQFVNALKMLLYLLFAVELFKDNKQNLINLYKYGYIFIALGIAFTGLLSFFINGFPDLDVRYTFSDKITINQIAIISSLCVVNLTYCLIKFNDFKMSLWAVLVSFCIFFGLLTQSRSFILGTGLGIALLIIFTGSKKRNFYLCSFILFAVVVVLVVSYIFPNAFDRVVVAWERIINSSNGDISNGRYILWDQTIQSMNTNVIYKFFGAGDFKLVQAVFDDQVLMAHNMFIETWVLFGYIGSGLVLVIYLICIKDYIFIGKINSFSITAMVPIIVLVCLLFFSHHFIGKTMSLFFLINFIPLANSKKESVL
ncbi:MAG: O-antigen ligase family protein [Clostridia bacterium]|nr:O-antigen ligase family protein [Clostridia bacterium]